MANKLPPIGPKQLHITAPAQADIDEALAYLRTSVSLRVALDLADKVGVELFRLADIGHGGISRMAQSCATSIRMSA